MSKKYLETIKSVDGVIHNLEYHQQRLESVLSSLNTQTTYNLSKVLHPPQKDIYRCRVVYDEKFINVEYYPYTKREIKTLKLVYSDTIEYFKKHENRDEINALFAKKEDCDDILIVKNSLITDTSTANVAFFDGEVWFTPKAVLLAGTSRARMIQEGKIIEKDIVVEDLKKFSKVALMNAMIDFDIIPKDNVKDIIC